MDNKNKDRLEGPILLSKGYGNSFKWIWQLKGIKHGPKALVGYLCSYMGAGNTAFPSRKKICYDLEINRDTLSKWLKVLTEDTTILQVEQVRNDNGQFSHNIYHLNFNPEIICPKLKMLNEESTESPQKSASAPWPKKPATVKPATVKPATNNNKDHFNNNKEKQQQNTKHVVVSSASRKEEPKSIITSQNNNNEQEQFPVTTKHVQAQNELLAAGVSMKATAELLENYPPEEILKAVDYTTTKTNIVNVGGFILEALRNNWSLPTIEEKVDREKTQTELLLNKLNQAKEESVPPPTGFFKKLKESKQLEPQLK